jgi:hypothetical protein
MCFESKAGNASSTDVTPVAGGFVCSSERGFEWNKLVVIVWNAYFESLHRAGATVVRRCCYAEATPFGGQLRYVDSCHGREKGSGMCDGGVCKAVGLTTGGFVEGQPIASGDGGGCTERSGDSGQLDGDISRVSLGRVGALSDGVGTDIRGDCGSVDALKERGRGQVSPLARDFGLLNSKVSGVGGRVASQSTRVIGRLPRGPNYERNRENRLRKKAAEASRRAGIALGCSGTHGRAEDAVGSQSFFSDLEESVQRELRETRAKRLILENKAKIAQLENDASRDRRGLTHAIEALKLVKIAKDSEKYEGRVAGWARTVVSGSSESIAKAAPSRVASFDSVGSLKSASDLKLSFKVMPLNFVEGFLVERRRMEKKKIFSHRVSLRRALVFEDFVGANALLKLDRYFLVEMLDYVRGEGNVDDSDSFRINFDAFV